MDVVLAAYGGGTTAGGATITYPLFGVVLKKQGKLDEAIAEYNEALNIRPDLREARALLARALGQPGASPAP